jgi:lipopolysaccharide heptosyltransferase I
MEETCPHVGQQSRVLIARLSHIGDCVLTLPMLTALRRAMPSAFIAWAVEAPSHQLLSLHRDIDELVLIPRGWMTSPRKWRSIRNELKRHRFDIAIDPQGITKSAVLGWLSGAKRRIGVTGRWGRELSVYLNNEKIEPIREHVCDRSLELLGLLGIQEREAVFNLPVCSDSLAKMKQFVQSRCSSQRFALVNPGASWPSKRWETERFAAVAQYLDETHTLKSIVTWAGQEEQDMARTIVSVAPKAAIMAPKTSLRELAALSCLSEFFVGCDTGPLHIAAAMGCRCLGLYGTTRPTESGAYGLQHIAVQKWFQSGTSRERRGADNQAMRDIQVDDVCRAVDKMIHSESEFQRRKTG